MYLGNSDELRQRIKDYNTGPSGNFIFNRRDLEPIGKTFRGTTPRGRDYEYVRDFAIVDTKPPKEDDTNWTDLKEEIKKIIQKRSKPGDNLWNSAPCFIYFYLGLRTFLDNDTWILVKRSHLYLAAKNGSNLSQPALRFTEQTPIKVLDLWDLKEELGIGGKLNKDIWEKIKQAEEELTKTEQKKEKEEREKLSALWTQTAREVHEILQGYEWEDLEFDSDFLELFFTDKCSCETPGEDWHQHMLDCVGRKFSEVEEFAKKLKEAMQKAVDKFTQLKETSIRKIEAELVAKGLSENEVFDSEFYSTSPNWGWDWRAKIRSVKHKFILEFREKDLISYIELKNKLKNMRNNTPPPPAGEPRNENLNGNQNEDQGSQNWEDWWEKQKQKWAQAEQAHQQETEEKKKKKEEKRKKQKEKEQQEEENLKSKWAEFEQQHEQRKQSEENNNDNSEFRPKNTEIPSFLLPEELEEISTDKNSSPSNKNNNFPNSPKNQPTLPKPEKKETREDLINKLKAEIETLKNILNKTPLQEKELRQKENYLRWLEDNKSSNSDQGFTKTITKSSFLGSSYILASLGVIIVGILLFLFIMSRRKRNVKN